MTSGAAAPAGAPHRIRRVLVISNLYPSPAFPAFGPFVAAHVEAMRRAGVSVDVVAITYGAAHERVASKYVSLMARSVAFAARALIARRRYRIVEAHIAYPTGLIAWPVARLLGARLVLFAHGTDVTTLAVRSRLHRALSRPLFSHADLVVANSRFLARRVARSLLTRCEPLVISPGIDGARFVAPPGEVDRSRSGIVFAGHLIPTKGADVLLRAVAILGARNAGMGAPRVTLLGDGAERGRLTELARELGVDAEFAGAVPGDRVAAAMRSAAVVVQPSVYEEPLGLVAIEGMAAGAMVVASATGGLMETVIDGETGFTAAAGDPSSLADALERALRAAEGADGDRIRTAAGAMAASHGIDALTARLLAAYDASREGPAAPRG